MAWPKSLSGSSAANCDLPWRLRRGNQPAHLLARRDAQRPHARLRLRRIVGEGQHRDIGRRVRPAPRRRSPARSAAPGSVRRPRRSPTARRQRRHPACRRYPWHRAAAHPGPSSASCAACSIVWPRSARGPDSGSRIATRCPAGPPGPGPPGSRAMPSGTGAAIAAPYPCRHRNRRVPVCREGARMPDEACAASPELPAGRTVRPARTVLCWFPLRSATLAT